MKYTEPTVAISIRQPWAWLILHAGKDHENRTWQTKFRGPLWIHAAKGMTREEYDWACRFAYFIAMCPVQIPRFEDLPRGGIVGRVDVIGCVSESQSFWFEGPHALVLANPEPVDFRPCRGALSLFRP
jgi:hypothetical protein